GRAPRRHRHRRRHGADLGGGRGHRRPQGRPDAGAQRGLMALVDFLLHFDRHLLDFVAAYGPWVYAILFAIIFVETGVVIWPFLPGDSLLFAAGALCATGSLSTPITAALLVAAAFAGDTVNYSIGRYIGPRVFAADGDAAISH